MTATVTQDHTLAVTLQERWQQVSDKLVELGEAIPEHEFDKSPVKDTRSCGAVLRHVAFWNQYVADSLSGKPVDDSTNEIPASEYATKAAVIEAVRQTSADVVKAMRKQRGALPEDEVKRIVSFLEHTSEHYGQMAIYARLMGVVPPASRG